MSSTGQASQSFTSLLSPIHQCYDLVQADHGTHWKRDIQTAIRRMRVSLVDSAAHHGAVHAAAAWLLKAMAQGVEPRAKEVKIPMTKLRYRLQWKMSAIEQGVHDLRALPVESIALHIQELQNEINVSFMRLKFREGPTLTCPQQESGLWNYDFVSHLRGANVQHGRHQSELLAALFTHCSRHDSRQNSLCNGCVNQLHVM